MSVGGREREVKEEGGILTSECLVCFCCLRGLKASHFF